MLKYILLFLPFSLNLLYATTTLGQAKTFLYEGEESIYMSVPDAAVVDFWARKGVTSTPLLQSLDLEVKLLESKVEFKDFIISNCQQAQEEYRTMVFRNAQEVQRLTLELGNTKQERDDFKEKARKRGEKLWAIAGTVGAGLAGFIFLKL